MTAHIYPEICVRHIGNDMTVHYGEATMATFHGAGNHPVLRNCVATTVATLMIDLPHGQGQVVPVYGDFARAMADALNRAMERTVDVATGIPSFMGVE